MKKIIVALFLVFASFPLFSYAQYYFAHNVEWKEICIDSERYDTWYSLDENGEPQPNFEVVSYRIGPSIKIFDSEYDYIYRNDSIYALLLRDNDSSPDLVYMTSWNPYSDEFLHETCLYDFGWEEGLELTYERPIVHLITSIWDYPPYPYGTIQKIETGNFGGDVQLEYVDFDSLYMIKNIGVTQWNYESCLLGPAIKQIHSYYRFEHPSFYYSRYKKVSRLVYFSIYDDNRDKKVLYDLWPSADSDIKSPTGIVATPQKKTVSHAYDLSGRSTSPNSQQQGAIYIEDGKKVLYK